MKPVDFALDLRASLTPSHHLSVHSGRCVAQPVMPTVCGVGDCFSPPLASRGLRFSVTFLADKHVIRDDGSTGKGDCGLLYAGGRWAPDRIERRGTYHHLVNGELISIAVESTLVPQFAQAGFVLRVAVRNRGPHPLQLDVTPMLHAGRPVLWPLSHWDYALPPEGREASQTSSDRWSNRDVDVRLVRNGDAREIAAGGAGEWWFTVTILPAGTPLAGINDPATLALGTTQAWERRLKDISQRLPRLESSSSELNDYYNRSLISGLVCLWERDDFVSNPFVATSGMDGGAICTYPWDVGGYAPNTLALLLGNAGAGLLRAMASFGVERHGRFSPAGNGLNVAYAYSGWSYISLVWAMACQHGPDAGIFDQAASQFLAIEQSLSQRANLADYGTQANLLEMRGAGWEHFTASPNAERAWCFDRLADLGEALGRGDPAAWRAHAASIRRHVRTELWDARAGWFRCIYPDSHSELIYSIQAFDALRAGVCDASMTQAMLAHIRDGAFLGTHGVSSVSAEDEEHYELNDPDWSGGGAYTGEGPQLAQILWELGQPQLAWDVLRRHFWMGRHLVYFPQEHYCDRPAVAAHKRANIVSGLTGVEAILFGLIGLSPRIDGQLWIRPQPPKDLSLALQGLAIGKHRIDVFVSPGDSHAVINQKRCPLHNNAWNQLI